MDILDFIRKNKEIVIIGVVVAILTLVGIWLMGQDGTPDGSYHDVIIEGGSSASDLSNLDVDSSISEPDANKMTVYKASDYADSDIEAIVSDFGFNVSSEDNSSGIYRVWTNGDSFARYNEDTGDLVVETEPIRLSRLEQGYLTKETAADYFREFVKEYLGTDQDVRVTVEEEDENFKVEAIWRIEGYDVVRAFGQEYSIIARFTESGYLTTLYANLVEFSATEESVDLVSVKDLSTYLQASEYPSEAFLNIVSTGPADCVACDTYGWYSSEDFQAGKITSADVAYYHSPISSTEVLPVYRLSGEGTVVDDDGTHRVGVTIYANAIDPSRIVIPTEE